MRFEEIVLIVSLGLILLIGSCQFLQGAERERWICSPSGAGQFPKCHKAP